MNKLIDWLSAHKIVNVLLLAVYYLAVVLPHKRFGAFLNTKVFKGITRDEYNMIVLFIAVLVLAIFSFLFLKNSSTRPFKRRLWFYMGANVLFAALVMSFLFVINIEVIHYPQYALFAILSHPLIKNYQQTLVWTTIAGSIDEAYQYFYLAPKDTSYYDFNDVVTNLVGAVFGLLFIRSFGITQTNLTAFFRSTAFYALIGIGLIIAVLCVIDVLSIYPSEVSQYQLLRKWPEGFWSTVHPNVTYHVMRPIEGTLVTIALWLFYSKIGDK